MVLPWLTGVNLLMMLSADLKSQTTTQTRFCFDYLSRSFLHGDKDVVRGSLIENNRRSVVLEKLGKVADQAFVGMSTEYRIWYLKFFHL